MRRPHFKVQLPPSNAMPTAIQGARIWPLLRALGGVYESPHSAAPHEGKEQQPGG